MNQSRLGLRTFDERCIAPFLALAATYYPEGHEARNPEYLRWAFMKNPAGAGRVAFAEGASGKWTGMMGLVPFRVRTGATRVVASMVVNVLVHPEHRQEKLFVKMIQHTIGELKATGEWLIGHPNAAAVNGWRRTNMGFRPGFDVRVVPPLVGKRARGGKRVKDARSPLLAADFSPLERWQESAGRPVIAADPAFLRWRFLEHPTRRHYRVFLDDTGGAVSGYRVDRPYKTGLVRFLVDWQGEEYWARGPERGLRPSIYAWPPSLPHSKTSVILPKVQKHYEFFATPCKDLANDGDPWSQLTLAATDFA